MKKKAAKKKPAKKKGKQTRALAIRKRPKRKRQSNASALSIRNPHTGEMIKVGKALSDKLLTIAATQQFSMLVEKVLDEPTPSHRIKRLPKEAGKKKGIAYVDDGYMFERLNKAFGKTGWRYDFEIVSPWEFISQTQYVIAKGTLEVLTPVGWLKRSQIGTGRVQFSGTKLVDPDIAFKGAATDAFKKCANSLGIAEDVYSGQHHAVKKIQKQEEQRVEKAESKVAKQYEAHQKKLFKLAQDIQKDKRASKDALIASLSWLLPKKKWKRGIPNLVEITKADAEIVGPPWAAVADGVSEIEESGMIK